jgi:hypothetical protein
VFEVEDSLEPQQSLQSKARHAKAAFKAETQPRGRPRGWVAPKVELDNGPGGGVCHEGDEATFEPQKAAMGATTPGAVEPSETKQSPCEDKSQKRRREGTQVSGDVQPPSKKVKKGRGLPRSAAPFACCQQHTCTDCLRWESSGFHQMKDGVEGWTPAGIASDCVPYSHGSRPLISFCSQAVHSDDTSRCFTSWHLHAIHVNARLGLFGIRIWHLFGILVS